MTPTEFKSIRLRAGLTQRQLAERLRVSDHRTIRRYETGEREISGPVSLLMEQLDRMPPWEPVEIVKMRALVKPGTQLSATKKAEIRAKIAAWEQEQLDHQ